MANNNHPHVIIYTDGSCSGNPGPGGWAAILMYGTHKKEIGGHVENTTNNRMEISAVVNALYQLKMSCDVEIRSDSALVVGAINGWLDKWRANNWRKSDKKPVENVEFWKAYLDASCHHNVVATKVTGHANDQLNNRADKLAVEYSKLDLSAERAQFNKLLLGATKWKRDELPDWINKFEISDDEIWIEDWREENVVITFADWYNAGMPTNFREWIEAYPFI